jgi:hypothetical protein
MVKNPQVNAILECAHQVLGQMLHAAEIDMAKSVTPNDIDVFLDNAHGQFALLITQYLKPHQVQPFLEKTCSLTLRSWLTGTKLENTSNQ